MLKLKNQFIMAPVKTGYGDPSGNITDKHLKFYEERCKYLGALTPEPLYLHKNLRELPTQIGIDSDDKIPNLQKFTDILHSYGTKAIAHLNHPGRMANPKIPGNIFISSTDKPCPTSPASPKKATKEDINDIIKLHEDAAIRTEKAGFDIIELQFGHGYLAAQFISPNVNDRDDEYGGSFDNRIRFALEILDAVKKSVNLPIIVRISADEMIPDGIKINEMIQFSQILQEKGVSAIHVSAGTACNTPPWFFQHMFVPKGKTWQFATQIKSQLNIPVIFVGQINSQEDIITLRNEFSADYIAVGRALVADADFVGKITGDVSELIKPCLACSEGCLGGVKAGEGLHCVVNPEVGTGIDSTMKAEIKKNIAIVGGGLAGMEAALTLQNRSHKVTLYEKDALGGQFNLAYLPPHKESLKRIVDYYTSEIQNSNITLINQEATANDLTSYDEIIIATGSKPAIPPIKGLTKYYWAEVLEEKHLPSNVNTLVIGGGLIGTEVASKLLSKGNNVIIVEMFDEIARGMEMIEKTLTLKALQNEKVKIFVRTKVEAVEDDKVFISNDEGSQVLENIDLIVLATGMKPYIPFDLQEFTKPVYVIGDARQAGKAQNAILDARKIAQSI